MVLAYVDSLLALKFIAAKQQQELVLNLRFCTYTVWLISDKPACLLCLIEFHLIPYFYESLSFNREESDTKSWLRCSGGGRRCSRRKKKKNEEGEGKEKKKK